MNVIGFDDAPFPREHRGDVLLVGAVCAGTRLDAIVTSRVRRDGTNATDRMIEAVTQGRLERHVQAVLLQGIAVAGFNVVDVHRLSSELDMPVLVVARRKPKLAAIRDALLEPRDDGTVRVPGGARKWALIQRAGPMERLVVRQGLSKGPSGLVGKEQLLWVQRVGLSLAEARRLVVSTTLHGHLPEPVRLAHLVAGGVTLGKSTGRA